MVEHVSRLGECAMAAARVNAVSQDPLHFVT
jgi:hypothetical protein